MGTHTHTHFNDLSVIQTSGSHSLSAEFEVELSEEKAASGMAPNGWKANLFRNSTKKSLKSSRAHQHRLEADASELVSCFLLWVKPLSWGFAVEILALKNTCFLLWAACFFKEKEIQFLNIFDSESNKWE